MTKASQISTSRIEAFSDGVIAIIITVMIFDLKLQEIPEGETVWPALQQMLPKFCTYVLSFLMVSIMWVNHHQLFQQIKHTNPKLLWLSIQLLFWMSLIPFGTSFIGANPMLWMASFLYGAIFFMSALSFTHVRNYVVKNDLLHDTISKQAHIRIRNKNRIAMVIYLAAAMLSILSVYLSFCLFLVVPSMYFVPEKIIHEEK